jgi:hypothetical protein
LGFFVFEIYWKMWESIPKAFGTNATFIKPNLSRIGFFCAWKLLKIVGEYPESFRDERHFYKTQSLKDWVFLCLKFIEKCGRVSRFLWIMHKKKDFILTEISTFFHRQKRWSQIPKAFGSSAEIRLLIFTDHYALQIETRFLRSRKLRQSICSTLHSLKIYDILF